MKVSPKQKDDLEAMFGSLSDTAAEDLIIAFDTGNLGNRVIVKRIANLAAEGKITVSEDGRYIKYLAGDSSESFVYDKKDDRMMTTLNYSQVVYDRKAKVNIGLVVNRERDKDILDWLSKFPNRQAYIKQLIRADMALDQFRGK